MGITISNNGKNYQVHIIGGRRPNATTTEARLTMNLDELVSLWSLEEINLVCNHLFKKSFSKISTKTWVNDLNSLVSKYCG